MSNLKQNTAVICENIAKPILLDLGLSLWDVQFEKEGSVWFLRYLIDKEGGIGIADCEKFSRTIDPVLDASDPIGQSYCLEVSSPGIERALTKQWHFDAYIGREVTATFVRARDGVKEIQGTLISHSQGMTILKSEDVELTISKKEVSTIKLVDNFEYNKGEDND